MFCLCHFGKSTCVFEAVRFSRSCILIIDSLWVCREVREGTQSCLWPKGSISTALNCSPCLSSCLAQKIDCALSVGFLLFVFSFFFYKEGEELCLLFSASLWDVCETEAISWHFPINYLHKFFWVTQSSHGLHGGGVIAFPNIFPRVLTRVIFVVCFWFH